MLRQHCGSTLKQRCIDVEVKSDLGFSTLVKVDKKLEADVETTLKRYTTLLQRYRSYRFYQALELMVNESFKWFIAKKIDGCYSKQIFNELES